MRHFSFAIERERVSHRPHFSAVEIDDAISDALADEPRCAGCGVWLGFGEQERCTDCLYPEDDRV